MKNFICIFLLLTTILCVGYRKPYRYVIDAERDAYYHNNVGLNYLRDRIYYAAIEEFKIAITLSPDTQATAVFQSNLGETYMYIGYPEMARICFEDALERYKLNFKYYLNLAECYEQLKIVQTKIKEYQASKSVYDKIMLGLLYIKTGETRRGIVVLDDVCLSEPDILITPAIKQYLKEQADKEIRE